MLIISCAMQAAEVSIENPPSQEVRAAALAHVKAKLEEEERLQRELDKIDFEGHALQGKHGCCAYLQACSSLFSKKQSRDKLFIDLDQAVRNGDVALVKRLFERKATPHAICSNGQTLLQNAPKPEIIRLLLEYKADVNALNREGLSALTRHCLPYTSSRREDLEAGRQNSIACVQALLECPGIEVNVLSKCEDHTPLNQLLRSERFDSANYIPLIAKLVERGADPYINNIYQENAYNLLKKKLECQFCNHLLVRDALRVFATQRNAVLTAVGTCLTKDTAGIVMIYAWGNLHNLLREAEYICNLPVPDDRCIIA